MRGFVAIIAIAAIIGVLTARHQFGAQVHATAVGNALGRISDIALSPLAANIAVNLAPKPKPPVNTANVQFDTLLSATNVIVQDQVTDEILFQKNAEEAHPLASITKLMSALILTEHISNWDATTTVNIEDVVEGNQAIVAGEVYTLADLLDAGLIGSYNTAINTMVRATGMTQQQFVEEMNQRAVDLGMHKMHFEEPTGLSPNNVASARDVARLTKIVLSEPHIKPRTVTQKSVIIDLNSGKKKVVKATDWFLNDVVQLKNATVEGGKTGYIPEAGYNFTVMFRGAGGHEIRVVVLGTKDVFARFTEAGKLGDWVFENFTWEK